METGTIIIGIVVILIMVIGIWYTLRGCIKIAKSDEWKSDYSDNSFKTNGGQKNGKDER